MKHCNSDHTGKQGKQSLDVNISNFILSQKVDGTVY